MPPKFKFTKDEIVNAAVEVVRERGVSALRAKDIAEKLGVSTQPVFTCFSTMAEARKEVYKIASTSLIDVINEKCDYLLIDYHKIDLDKIDEIKNIANSHNVSCIFNNIDDKNDLDKANNYQFDYIYGKYYKKAIRMKNLVEKVS